MADQVLYSGVACITDLMVKEGLINLDFADVRSIMSEMGKAMMGTGEATGERRAVLAAEAAIANPLLDETSMRGARGLLISITGGNDLTLYEVDEAASRIRQEVDEEANIILGATFEPSLDGVVRVSVVATGIDQAILSQAETATAQPRNEPAPRPRPAPVRQAAAASNVIEMQQPAMPYGNDVEIQPLAPPAAFPEPIEAYADPQDEDPHFIPPAPEQVVRAARMPQIEDLPQVAQRQLNAIREAQGAPAAAPETRRKSLLEKLAAFGITRHEDEPAGQRPAAAAPPPPSPLPAPRLHQALSSQPELARPHPRAQQVRSAAAGSLDPHGRPTPRLPVTEDDQLDIPAFLRRQPN